MVHGHQALLFVAPLKHREVDYPEACELVLVAQAKLAAHLQAKLTKLLAGLHGIVATHDQDEIAGLSIHGFAQGLQGLLVVEFVNRTLYCAVFAYASINQALGADLAALHEVGKLVELLACVMGCSLGIDAADVSRIVKY